MIYNPSGYLHTGANRSQVSGVVMPLVRAARKDNVRGLNSD